MTVEFSPDLPYRFVEVWLQRKVLGNVRGGIVDPLHPTRTGSKGSETVDMDAQEASVKVVAR